MSETIPFDQEWPAFGNFIRETFLPEGFGTLEPGKEVPVFSLEGSRFSVSICYEISFAYLARRAREEGADFLVSISNDAWFKKGAELDLAKDQAIFRAVENRVGIARAANTGISSFVDPLGRSEILTKDGERKEVRGVLVREIWTSPSRTIYGRIGDLFAWCAVLGALFILLPFKRLRARREAATG
jgi:apolipoprotein N-acyltransferase